MAVRKTPDRQYVQFSKRIVVAVTTMVTLICITAIVLNWNLADAAALTAIVRVYIEYAMIVFACYSSNSIAEKLILQKYKSSAAIVDDSDDAEG